MGACGRWCVGGVGVVGHVPETDSVTFLFVQDLGAYGYPVGQIGW